MGQRTAPGDLSLGPSSWLAAPDLRWFIEMLEQMPRGRRQRKTEHRWRHVEDSARWCVS